MMQEHQQTVVALRDLSKSFGQINAVDNLSLSVCRGDIYGFLGPNGSGKSTTIRMMLSLIRPDSGEVLLFGERLTDHNRSILRKVGALIERPDFYNYLSAYRNLEILAGYSGVDADKKKIFALLEMVGLYGREHSKVKTFSQGMKQRLGIAQALLHEPELIILDEPVNGLDPQGIRDMRELILRLNREHGKTLIISSHILREMELVANRMVVISKGRVVAEGNVHELIKDSGRTLNLLTNKPEESLQLLKKHFPRSAVYLLPNGELEMEAMHIDAPAISRLIVENGIELHSLSSRNSLEDYFLQVT
ncbi:MAG: ABC transporter ATP-binding protein [Bacteroidia bacterium]|jgi:ABC-type multidrug transport system ATPase subunit|nr:ABC transporter ATP-binding protein [Bacteroidia bacterium]